MIEPTAPGGQIFTSHLLAVVIILGHRQAIVLLQARIPLVAQI